MVATPEVDELVRLRAMVDDQKERIARLVSAIYRRVEVGGDGTNIDLGTQNGWPEDHKVGYGRWALIKFLSENGAEISEGHDGRGDHKFVAKFHGLTFRWAYDSSG